jgi:hypothetical protein
MSRFQRLSLALSAAALVISALGFTAVIISIRTAQEQLSCTTAQTSLLIKDRSLATVLALDKLFLDYPEIRPYFYEGKDLDEAHPLYPKVEAAAEMHLDVFDYNISFRKSFPQQYHHPEASECYIRDMLAKSPVMRRRLTKKAEWFSPDLRKLATLPPCDDRTD